MKGHLEANGMAMQQGLIILVSLIAAPSSTHGEAGGRAWRSHKNKDGEAGSGDALDQEVEQYCGFFAGIRLRHESPYRSGEGHRCDPFT